MTQKIRVAAFQRQPVFDDIAQTTRRLRADVAWCEDENIDLAIFPECYLQGYSTDPAVIARRAMQIDGVPFRSFLSELAPSTVDVVVGFIERREDGLYNSAVVIANGIVKGVYAKTHPNEKAFLPGRDAPVFSRSNFPFGINICADANFSSSATALRDKGAQLICYPLNNMLLATTAEKWQHKSVENLRSRARETGCWVASSDVVGARGEQISHGCTCIVNPQGVIVARVPEGDEGVAVYDAAAIMGSSSPYQAS